MLQRIQWLALVAIVAGCSGSAGGTDADVDAGGWTFTDAGGSDDAASDATQADQGNPAPTCEGLFPLDPEACNPTSNGECPEDGFCTFAVIGGAPPPRLACLPRDNEGTGAAGDPCVSVTDCREGTTCVDWTGELDPRGRECTRFCEIESERGCLAGEFCTKADRLPAADGIGVCTPACDPHEPGSCAAGQTCAPDYQYPANTCEPHFRCLDSTAPNGAGESCGPAAGLARCAPGVTCYETGDAQYRCVQPCGSDADCGGQNCGRPTGLWRLRYCE